MSTDTFSRQEDPSIPARECKQRRLASLDEVSETGIAVVVTKRGRPVARVVPISSAKDELKGGVHALTEDEEDLFSAGGAWRSSRREP